MGCGAFAPEHPTLNAHLDFTVPQDSAPRCRVILEATEREQLQQYL